MQKTLLETYRSSLYQMVSNGKSSLIIWEFNFSIYKTFKRVLEKQRAS
jgi:hypothetical protein